MTTLRTMLYAGALAATAIAAPAMANDNNIDLGTIAPGKTGSTMSSHVPGSFTDMIKFNITQSGSDGAVAYFNFTSRFTNISNAMLTLTGPTAFATQLSNAYDQTLALASGGYTARITGNATGVSGGSYSFGITAPTPEPEIWLSLAAGAGMAGFMARRRRKQMTAA